MLHPKQIEVYRRMTPTEKWRQSKALYFAARRRKAAFLRQRHPDWDEEQIEREVVRIFLHARS